MLSRIFVLCTTLVLVLGCQAPEPESADDVRAADIIFTGEHILTLDDSLPTVDAVAVAGQEILAIGNLDDILRHKTAATRLVELGERALIPGFIDAHGHMPFVARQIEIIDLASPPVGTVKDIDDIIALVKAHVEAENVPQGTWVFGFGYDDSLDVFGVHAVGGIIGALLTGIFCAQGLGGVGFGDGITGIGGQVWVQLIGITATVVYSGTVSFVILKAVDAVVGLRVDDDEETEGLDLSQHDERGYNL